MAEQIWFCQCQHTEGVHSHITGRCLECWRKNRRKSPCKEFHPIPAGWHPIKSAPKNAVIAILTEAQEDIPVRWVRNTAAGWHHTLRGCISPLRGRPIAWQPLREPIHG